MDPQVPWPPDEDSEVQYSDLDPQPRHYRLLPFPLLEGAHLSTRTRKGLLIASILTSLLLIVLVIAPIVSPLLFQRTQHLPIVVPPVSISAISTDHGINYITGSNGMVQAIQGGTGHRLWQTRIGAQQIPLTVDGKVYIPAVEQGKSILKALNPLDGKPQWVKEFGMMPQVMVDSDAAYLLPSRVQQNVFVDADDNLARNSAGSVNGEWLSAFSLNKKVMLWRYPLGGLSQYYVQIAEDKVYLSELRPLSYQSSLTVLNYLTGKMIWNSFCGTGDSCYRPTITNGLVYLTGRDGTVKALDVDTGAVHWQTGEAQNSLWGAIIRDNIAYVNENGWIKALRADTGTMLWRYKITVPGTFPFPSHGVVCFKNQEHGLDVVNVGTGSRISQIHFSAEPLAQFYIVVGVQNDIVYITSNFGSFVNTLYAYKIEDGSLLWQHSIAGQYKISLNQGVLYLDDGAITAIDSLNGDELWRLTLNTQKGIRPNKMLNWVVIENQMYILPEPGRLEVRRPEDSSLIWRYSLS